MDERQVKGIKKDLCLPSQLNLGGRGNEVDISCRCSLVPFSSVARLTSLAKPNKMCVSTDDNHDMWSIDTVFCATNTEQSRAGLAQQDQLYCTKCNLTSLNNARISASSHQESHLPFINKV